MGIFRSALPSDKNQPLQQIRNRVPEILYDLRDEFITARLPGAVNGTLAEPGPGTRLCGASSSITGGKLSEISPVFVYKYAIKLRSRGEICKIDITTPPIPIIDSIFFGWSADIWQLYMFRYSIDGFLRATTEGTPIAIIFDGDYFSSVVCLRYPGAYYLGRGIANNTNYKLMWITESNLGFTDYTPSVFSEFNSIEVDYIAVPEMLWLPKPIVSDGFGLANQPVAIDYGGTNNGDYVQVGLNGESNKAFFDGTNSYCDVYSAGVNAKFDGRECSLIIRGRARNAGLWTDGTARVLIRFYVDAQNFIQIFRTAVNNQLSFSYTANGAASGALTVALGGSVNWFTLGITGSDTNNQLRAYIDGVEDAASPVANAGSFTGNLSITDTVIGAQSTVPAAVWRGWLSDAIAVYNLIVVTPAQMAIINAMLVAGTMTENWLNTEFGFGNWSWWKLNESFDSDGLGHQEGVSGGIGSGGAGIIAEQVAGSFDYVGGALNCVYLSPLGWANAAVMVYETKKQDVLITAGITIGGGTCGIVTRYVDNNNFMYAIHDGANMVLVEVVAGVQAVLINIAVAYVAGARIRLIIDDQLAMLYYEGAGFNTFGSSAFSDILTGTKHGVFSDVVGSLHDNLNIYARGTDGEYNWLEDF